MKGTWTFFTFNSWKEKIKFKNDTNKKKLTPLIIFKYLTIQLLERLISHAIKFMNYLCLMFRLPRPALSYS